MKLLALAIITGVALAAGVLGTGLNNISGSGPSLSPEADGNLTQPQGALPLIVPSLTPAAHSNSNTEGRTVYLNERVIQGRPTVLCTTNTHLLTALPQTVTIWNDALSGSLSIASDDGPFSVHPEVGGPPANCDDNRPALDIDVVVVFERSTDDSIYDGRKSRRGELPRRFFETDEATSYPNPDDHATLVLRRDDLLSTTLVPDLVPTLVHELGHVLGLSDYKTCDGLRVLGSGAAADDPDLHDQHYALMYNAPDRLCRPLDQTTIPDRDLRDLYEAYHVAPITNVHLAGNPTLSIELAIIASFAKRRLRA